MFTIDDYLDVGFRLACKHRVARYDGGQRHEETHPNLRSRGTTASISWGPSAIFHTPQRVRIILSRMGLDMMKQHCTRAAPTAEIVSSV